MEAYRSLTKEEVARVWEDYYKGLAAGRNMGFWTEHGGDACSQVVRESLRGVGALPEKAFAKYNRLQLQQGRAKADLLTTGAARPAPGGVAFIGSSTFTYWRRLQEDFPEHSVYNGAFGGSSVQYFLDDDLFSRLVVQHQPRCVVYYCGVNDITHLSNQATAVAGFIAFHKRVRQELGDGVRVVYVAMAKTPLVRGWAEAMAACDVSNKELMAFCDAADPPVTFVDTNSLAWCSDPSFYFADQHHLNDEGHSCLANAIRPHLPEETKSAKSRL